MHYVFASLYEGTRGWGGARWPSGLERWTGDRVVLGSNPAVATLLRNFGNSVYPCFARVFRMRQ